MTAARSDRLVATVLVTGLSRYLLLSIKGLQKCRNNTNLGTNVDRKLFAKTVPRPPLFYPSFGPCRWWQQLFIIDFTSASSTHQTISSVSLGRLLTAKPGYGSMAMTSARHELSGHRHVRQQPNQPFASASTSSPSPRYQPYSLIAHLKLLHV